MRASALVFLQYICYPWKDDSGVAASEKRDLCIRSSDCKRPGQECVRHEGENNRKIIFAHQPIP